MNRFFLLTFALLLFFSCRGNEYKAFLKRYPENYFNEIFSEIEKKITEQYKNGAYKEFIEYDYSSDNTGVIVRVKKNGTQKGCIGFIKGIDNIPDAAVKACINAMLFDSRFIPLKKNDLNDIEIELTILGEFKRMNGPYDFDISKHTLSVTNYVKNAYMQNTIAMENNYSKKKFIEELQKKAGITADELKILKNHYSRALSVTRKKYYKKFNIEN